MLCRKKNKSMLNKEEEKSEKTSTFMVSAEKQDHFFSYLIHRANVLGADVQKNIKIYFSS